ncbi:MAG: xanthine dehydrogenase family protein molybdopterin-binding subunit [Chloroflexota bacterium]
MTPSSSVARLDGPDKTTGRAVYGMDLVRPGMLHGRVLRSLIPHGRIVSIDTSDALAMPGVQAILTAADVPTGRFGGAVNDVPLLAADVVRYAGEPIALVAATSARAADEALAAIQVDIDELPLVDDVEQALEPDAPLVHPNWADYEALPGIDRQGNICSHTSIARGDPTAAFAQAAHVIEERYQTAMVHQGYMEPRAALAEATPDGRLTVWSTTQLPFLIRDNLAAILGVSVGRIRVISTVIGGGFGGKLRILLEPYCALLALRTGRPVRMTMSVEEELTADAPRAASVTYIRSAVDVEGRILARQVRILFDCGAYAGSAPAITSVGSLVALGPYRLPNVRIDAYGVYTNKANTGSYRAPSGPQVNFAVESHMDEIAYRLGIDPLELRLRNALEDGDIAANGQTVSGVSIRQVLQQAADAIGWSTPATAAAHTGKGIACTWWTTTQGSSAASVRANEDGSIVVTTGCAEIGTGAIAAGVPQLVAERLGVSADNVIVVSADTDTTPYDLGAQGSRSLYMAGSAALVATDDLVDKLHRIAADDLEASLADLELRDGAVHVRGVPGRARTIGDLVRAGMKKGGVPVGIGNLSGITTDYDTHCVQHSVYPAFNEVSFAAHAAEVSVDAELGTVSVLRYVAAHDVGHAVHRGGIEGQIEGGVAQGLGQALTEQIAMSDGMVLNPNLSGYRMLSAVNMPRVETVLTESPSEHGPFGVKGIGEPPIVPPAAAVGNAIRAACGARVRSLPMLPERVLDALDQVTPAC